VDPALVLLEVQADDSLKKFALESAIPLLEIHEAERRILVRGDEPELGLWAVGHRYLERGSVT
jgi:hypothetical protein